MKNKLNIEPKEKIRYSDCLYYENKSSGLASIEYDDGSKYEEDF